MLKLDRVCRLAKKVPGTRRIMNLLVKCLTFFTYNLEALYRWLLYKYVQKRKILFISTRENQYFNFAPIHKLLSSDSRLNMFFTNETCLYHEKPVEDFFVPYGVPLSQIHKFGWRTLWQRWDLCIESDYTYLPMFRPTLRVQIFHGGANKFVTTGANFTLNKQLARYDRLFCMSLAHTSILQGSGLLKYPEAAVCIGYPKLDALLDGSISRDEVVKSYGAETCKRTVLYAPSWNPQLSLHQIGEELIDLLVSRDWTLLVKLHPISYYTKPRPPQNTWSYGHDWTRFLDERVNEGKLIHVRDQDTCRYLTAADVLITDHGSTLFEYMALDRPIIYYDTPEASSIVSDPEELPKIRQAVNCFSRPDEAFALLESGSEDSASMSEMRRQISKERFYDVGGATERAVAEIYKLLYLHPMEP